MEIAAFLHAYVGHGHEAGGETTMHDLLKFLVSEGWDAKVQLDHTVASVKEPYEVDGVRVLPYKHGVTAKSTFTGADVAIGHLMRVEDAAAGARSARVPFVHLVHNNFPITLRGLRKGFDLAVYNSDWVRESFAKRGLRRGKDITVHPPVNPADYAPAARGKHDSVVFVNPVPIKGPEIFWGAAEENPDLPFVVVKGGYELIAQDLSPALELDNVKVLPNEPGLIKPLRAARVVLMPSHYDSFGRVAVEAAAAGVPAIVSDQVCFEEALGDAGVRLPQNALTQWSCEIRRMFEDEPYYQERRKAAKLRSAQLWEQTERERALFLDRVTELGERSSRRRR